MLLLGILYSSFLRGEIFDKLMVICGNFTLKMFTKSIYYNTIVYCFKYVKEDNYMSKQVDAMVPL